VVLDILEGRVGFDKDNRAIVGVIIYAALWLALPPESAVDTEGNIDWFGAFLGLSALILFNFVWK
jgi:hypothetical protein